MKRLLPLCLAAVFLLSGCGTSNAALPSNVEYPTFGGYAQQWVYRAPNATEYLYTADLPSDFVPLLNLHWNYPTPFAWHDRPPTEAVKQVCAYFQEEGLLLDKEAWLKTAQADYADAQTTEREFFDYTIMQDTYCSYETERFWAFQTDVNLPAHYPHDNNGDIFAKGYLFDKATGEAMELWDLFTVPAEEAIQRLTAFENSPAQQEAMRRAFDPAWVSLRPDTFHIAYPPGTVMETAFIFTAAYADLQDILQPWVLSGTAGT